MESTNEFLGIIKNFMIDLHSEINQSIFVEPEHLETINQAAAQLKKNQESLSTLQNQNAQYTTSRAATNDYKKECEHLEKRLNRKTQQIEILKETVKTLYADNQKIVKQKQQTNKQTASLKQQITGLKKKIKRQEEEMSNHKSELQKLSSLAEQRLNEYLKEDQQKQIKIKKLQNQIEKLKTDLGKKDKAINSANKKLEQLKGIQKEYENTVTALDNLKYENSLLRNQLDTTKQKIHDEKVKYLQENQSLLKQIQEINQKYGGVVSEKQQLQTKLQTQLEKSQSYEEQIVMRTQKLKQKNKQIKVYNDEIEKLAKRVKELSEMADEVINQNRELSEKNRILEQKLEQFKLLYSHVGKLKGQINQKKSVQLGRLIESINKLQASL